MQKEIKKTDFNAMIDALVSCDADKLTGFVNDALLKDTPVEAGLRDQVKILVGDAPVTQSFADEIGEDMSMQEEIQPLRS